MTILLEIIAKRVEIDTFESLDFSDILEKIKKEGTKFGVGDKVEKTITYTVINNNLIATNNAKVSAIAAAQEAAAQVLYIYESAVASAAAAAAANNALASARWVGRLVEAKTAARNRQRGPETATARDSSQRNSKHESASNSGFSVSMESISIPPSGLIFVFL